MLYDKMSDNELVSAFMHEDKQAFEVLLSRHQSKIFNYILYRLIAIKTLRIFD